MIITARVYEDVADYIEQFCSIQTAVDVLFAAYEDGAIDVFNKPKIYNSGGRKRKYSVIVTNEDFIREVVNRGESSTYCSMSRLLTWCVYDEVLPDIFDKYYKDKGNDKQQIAVDIQIDKYSETISSTLRKLRKISNHKLLSQIINLWKEYTNETIARKN